MVPFGEKYHKSVSGLISCELEADIDLWYFHVLVRRKILVRVLVYPVKSNTILYENYNEIDTNITFHETIYCFIYSLFDHIVQRVAESWFKAKEIKQWTTWKLFQKQYDVIFEISDIIMTTSCLK